VRRGALGIACGAIHLPRRMMVHPGLSREGAVRVAGLQSDGPGEAAGLRQGDVILTLDDQPVAGIDDLTGCSRPTASISPAASSCSGRASASVSTSSCASGAERERPRWGPVRSGSGPAAERTGEGTAGGHGRRDLLASWRPGARRLSSPWRDA
jgi:hypothetical protein